MRLAGKVLAFFGSAIVALVVGVVLAGISQSGVVNMQITHTLFWLAFGISAVTTTLGVWLTSRSFKDALLALLLTVFIVGGGLRWLDSWLSVKKAEQDVSDQPPSPLYTTAQPPTVPIIKTLNPAKAQQDNSVNIGRSAFLAQKSTGNCSPNIIGGSSTVNCGLSAQKSGLELGISLVDPIDPAIVVDNQTDSLAEGITWELVMFRTTDKAFFSYATQNVGYVKPHSKGSRQSMQLNTLVQAPGGGGRIASGESFIGTLSIDCPLCRGTTLIVSFVWGSSGWFYKVPDGDGRLILPKGISKDTVSQFIDRLNTVITPELRIPIS